MIEECAYKWDIPESVFALTMVSKFGIFLQVMKTFISHAHVHTHTLLFKKLERETLFIFYNIFMKKQVHFLPVLIKSHFLSEDNSSEHPHHNKAPDFAPTPGRSDI